MTTTIAFIRHAAHDRLDRVLCGRMAGVELGSAGRAQAERLANRFGSGSFAAVYASPLERAQQTASPLAARGGLPLATDDDLNEIDVGTWAGQTFDDLGADPLWERWNRVRLQARPPGGESMIEAQARVVRFVHRTQFAHPGASVAAVSHGDLIKSALCWAMGVSLEAYARLEVGPASVSRIVVGDWGARVCSCNEVAP